jgi:hypothetical protein
MGASGNANAPSCTSFSDNFGAEYFSRGVIDREGVGNLPIG